MSGKRKWRARPKGPRKRRGTYVTAERLLSTHDLYMGSKHAGKVGFVFTFDGPDGVVTSTYYGRTYGDALARAVEVAGKRAGQVASAALALSYARGRARK
jgi:hypothetical protein